MASDNMYTVRYHLWIEVRGEAYLDFEPTDPNDLAEYLFSDECDCEIWDVTKNPGFSGEGYMEVEPDPDNEEDEEEDECDECCDLCQYGDECVSSKLLEVN